VPIPTGLPTIFLATSRQGAQRPTAGFGKQIVRPKVEQADRNSKSRILVNQTKSYDASPPARPNASLS